MSRFLVFATFLLFTSPALAQEPVSIPTKSKNFHIKATLETPPNWEGRRDDDPGFPGQVTIYRKGQKESFQKIAFPMLATNGLSPENSTKMKAGELVAHFLADSFVFEDFNFDGREDLAICTGRDGGYDGPSYDIFIFDSKQGKFIKNDPLTELTINGYLGLFRVEKKAKRLKAQSKAGCCIHQTDYFKMRGNRPDLVMSIIEQYESDTKLTITTRKKVGGRWVQTSRTKKAPRAKQ